MKTFWERVNAGKAGGASSVAGAADGAMCRGGSRDMDGVPGGRWGYSYQTATGDAPLWPRVFPCGGKVVAVLAPRGGCPSPGKRFAFCEVNGLRSGRPIPDAARDRPDAGQTG
ncbi:hypothetical protein MVI01_11250 [Myxococcus virescens]|uniref:Uncharacterized protein n=1 Tax=Myxococcus virescens TaxID=83456 RepID=A0A511H744_9BACT|nr:hypothetical protein MVI01_11250 [Myxococcus virescens]